MYLGIGLANLINFLDPQIIVISGGAANGWICLRPRCTGRWRNARFARLRGR
jgi:predicted NBD/HSP70 family sugar kinase